MGNDQLLMKNQNSKRTITLAVTKSKEKEKKPWQFYDMLKTVILKDMNITHAWEQRILLSRKEVGGGVVVVKNSKTLLLVISIYTWMSLRLDYKH